MNIRIMIVGLLICYAMSFSIASKAQQLDSASAYIDYDSVYGSYKTYYSLEEALKEPLQVQKLDLSLQKIVALPIEIGQFENLVYLDLSFNKFGLLPAEFAQLKKLEYLNLTGTRSMTKVPQVLSKLPALKIVDLRDHPEWPASRYAEARKLLIKTVILQ